MKRIGFITNFNVPEKSSTAFEAAHQAELAGAVPVFPVYVSTEKSLSEKLRGTQAVYAPLSELYATCDAVFIIGGDGSVIDAAKRAAQRSIPILGINRGRVGYMTELEPDELDRIPAIVRGEFRTEKRFMLRAEVFGRDGLLWSGIALNDAVLSNGSNGRIVELSMTEAGEPVSTYRADGLIFSTPTGSTAYSLAAGGPVLDPRMRGFCVTPICAHSPYARPAVFSGESVLEVTNISQRNPESVLTMDGKFAVKLLRNDMLRISDSGLSANLIRVKPQKYYQSLCKKID